MKTLITAFISLDGVVQAPGGPTEDTDGGFKHGGCSMKYFDPVAMGCTFAEIAAKSDVLLQGRRSLRRTRVLSVRHRTVLNVHAAHDVTCYFPRPPNAVRPIWEWMTRVSVLQP